MATSILVVDDDPITGELSAEILKDAGFDVQLLSDSLKVLDAMRQKRYPIVVLDILMPGLDGLTLCHKIKSDPQLKSTKVVMVSGKSFAAEKKRAYDYGADLFIEKPYDVTTFPHKLSEIAARVDEPVPATSDVPTPESLSSPAPAMQIAVWGCRSAVPMTPSRYGVNTSCVSVDLGEALIVFDAGTGIKALGDQIAREARSREAWLFISHFHKGHVQGLGSFLPAQNPQFLIHAGGAKEPDKSFQSLLEESFQSSLENQAPVEAQFELHEMLEETYEVMPGVTMTSFYANHPGTTLAFILQARGRRLVFCPDSEIYGETATALQDYDEKLGKLCAGADLLIHDGRYTPADYRIHKNTGHSSFESAVDCAGRHGVKKLLLFHQDAKYDDEQLDRMGAEAAKMSAERGYGMACAVAREGARIGI